MSDAPKESPGMSVAEWRGRKQSAWWAFIVAYAAMKEDRTHDNEREVAKTLAACTEPENMSREVFKQAFALMDDLVADEWSAWARVFRDAIKAGVPGTPIWKDLKCCYRADGSFLVVMTKAVPAELGPEEIRLYGDTRVLLGSLRDGPIGDTPGLQRHKLDDSTEVIFIPTV